MGTLFASFGVVDRLIAVLVGSVLLSVALLVAVHVFIRGARCPACRKKQLVMTDARKGPIELSWTEFKCRACDERFRSMHQRGLVPLEAWERGMREPPPKMTLR